MADSPPRPSSTAAVSARRQHDTLGHVSPSLRRTAAQRAASVLHTTSQIEAKVQAACDAAATRSGDNADATAAAPADKPQFPLTRTTRPASAATRAAVSHTPGEYPWPVPAAMPAPAKLVAATQNIKASDMASVLTGHSIGGTDLQLVDQYLSLLTGEQPGVEAAEGAEGDPQALTYRNLARLGLDRKSLERHGVPDHYIGRLHYLLYVNALAFGKGLAEEQRRMGLLLTQRDGVPLPDRLLAYMIGDQQSSPMDDLSTAATDGPMSAMALPGKWQGAEGLEVLQMSCPAPKGTTDVKVPDNDVFLSMDDSMPLEEIVSLATIGNTAGLRRLLGRYRAMHAAVRSHLEGRLSHETARAQRLQDTVNLRDAQLADAIKDAESCRAGIASAESQLRVAEKALASEREVTQAERTVNEALRSEIAQLEASWSSQQEEAVSRITEQLEALHSQSEGQLDLRDQYLDRTRECVLLQLKYDHELRKGVRQAAEVEAARQAADSANAQLQVLNAWRDRLEARAAAAEGLAAACRAAVAEIQRRLSKEEAAHRKTREHADRLHHQIEAARCVATDTYARGSAQIRRLACELREKTAQVQKLERQLQEGKDILKIRQFEMEGARAQSRAAQLQLDKVLEEMKAHQSARIQSDLRCKALDELLVDLRKDHAKLEDQLAELKAKLGMQTDLSESQAAQLAELQQFKEDMEAHMARMAEMEDTKARLEAEMEMLKVSDQDRLAQQEQLKQLQADLLAAREETQAVQQQLEELTQEAELIKQERESARAQLEVRSSELSASTALLDSTKLIMAEKQETLDKGLVEEASKVEEIQRLQKQVHVLTNELTMEQDKVATLQDQVTELTKLHGVIQGLRNDLRAALDRARVAEAAQVAALTDKTWWLQARQQLVEGMEEAAASSQAELQSLTALGQRVQVAMKQVQGQMLSLPPRPRPPAPRTPDLAVATTAAQQAAGQPEPPVLGYGRATSTAGIAEDGGEDSHQGPASLENQDPGMARQLASDLHELSSRLAALVDKQANMRGDLVQQLEGLERASPATRQVASQQWRKTLDAMATDPMKAMEQLKTQLATTTTTSQSEQSEVTNLGPSPSFTFSPTPVQHSPPEPAADSIPQADSPFAVLSKLAPVQLVEQQGDQIATLRAVLGEIQGARLAAEVQATSLQASIEAERQVADERQERWTLLVDKLQAEIAELQAHVAAAQGGRVLAERATLAVSKQLLQSEYQVSKAEEREVTLGVPGLVPLDRVDRAVQTVYSELWVHSPPVSAAEVARRSPGLSGVPSWGGELGSGSVALPPSLDTQRGQEASPPWPVYVGGGYTVEHTASAVDAHNAAHLSGFYASLTAAAASLPGSSKAEGPHRPKSQGGIATPRLDSDAAHVSKPLVPAPDARVSSPRSSKHTTGGASSPTQAPGSPQPQQRRPSRIDSAGLPATTASRLNISSGARNKPPENLTIHAQSPTAPPAALHAAMSSVSSTKPDAAPRPQSATDTATSRNMAGPRLLTGAAQAPTVWAGRGIREWGWLQEVAPLVASGQTKVLGLQDTMDLIADVYRAKAVSDAAAESVGYLPASLSVFLGAYVDEVYAKQYGPRPLQPMAIIVASVLTHAGVYEVRMFGRSTGILPQAPATDGGALTRSTSATIRARNTASSTPGNSRPGSPPRGPSTPRSDDSIWGSPRTMHANQSNRTDAGALQRRSSLGGDSWADRQGKAGSLRNQRQLAGPKGFRPSTAFPTHQHYTDQQQSLKPQLQGSGQLSRRQRMHQGPAESMSLVPMQLQPADEVAQFGAHARPLTASNSQAAGHCLPSRAAADALPLDIPPAHTLNLKAPVTMEALWPLADALTEGTGLAQCMQRLADVQGAEDVIKFIAAGRHMDHLTLDTLGTPILEQTAPVLHHLAARVSQQLALDTAPDLFLHPACSPVTGLALLLHTPHVSDAVLVNSWPDGRRAPRLADGSFGWRRRAILLLAPEVVAPFLVAGHQPIDANPMGDRAYAPVEVMALLATALAPMALPGGGGWRLNLHVAQGGSVDSGNSGVGPGGVLAVADAVTAVTLAHAAPEALVPHLPVQLRVKWARIYAVLHRVQQAAAAAGDRAALHCGVHVEDVAVAIGKASGVQPLTTFEDLMLQVTQQYPQIAAMSPPYTSADSHTLPQRAVLPPLVDLDLPLLEWATASSGTAGSRQTAYLRMAHALAWADLQDHAQVS